MAHRRAYSALTPGLPLSPPAQAHPPCGAHSKLTQLLVHSLVYVVACVDVRCQWETLWAAYLCGRASPGTARAPADPDTGPEPESTGPTELFAGYEVRSRDSLRAC